MPEPWQMTLSEFVGPWRVRDGETEDERNAMERDAENTVLAASDDSTWFLPSLRPSVTSSATWIIELSGADGDVVAVVRDFEGKWDTVGGYVGPMLWVAPSVRKRGLGAELVLAKADLCNGRLEPVEYSTAGRATHVLAHRMSVEAALKAGMRVPRSAMAGHENLAAA